MFENETKKSTGRGALVACGLIMAAYLFAAGVLVRQYTHPVPSSIRDNASHRIELSSGRDVPAGALLSKG